MIRRVYPPFSLTRTLQKGQLNRLEMPGIASGNVVVDRIAKNGWTLVAQPGHPTYPGSVSFTISVRKEIAYLDVTGSSSVPVPGGNGMAYDVFSDGYWADFAGAIGAEMNR